MGRRKVVWGGGRWYGEEEGGMGRRVMVWGGWRWYGEDGWERVKWEGKLSCVSERHSEGVLSTHSDGIALMVFFGGMC